MVRQSFDIFNIYGKEPETVTNITLGFAIALENCDIVDIKAAFNAWLKETSVMPTPADILKKAEEFRAFRFQNANGSKKTVVNRAREPHAEHLPDEERTIWRHQEYTIDRAQAASDYFLSLPTREERLRGKDWFEHARRFYKYPWSAIDDFNARL